MFKKIGPDFLITGLERSGTHWVAGLLNAHPEISCFPADYFDKGFGEYNREIIGEVHLFNTLASLELNTEDKHTRPISGYLTKHNLIFADLAALEGKVPKEELYNMFIKRYNEICEENRYGKKMVGESTPAYVFHLDFIDSFYPNIKKLCIIRDPKDKIVSWHFSKLRKGQKTEVVITDEFIKEYCEKTIKKEYESLLDYKGNIYCFTYESLAENQNGVLCDILSYLDVAINADIISHMIKEGSFKEMTAKGNITGGRDNGQEELQSPYRKGVVGDWVNHMTKKQAELVDAIVGEVRKMTFNKYKIY